MQQKKSQNAKKNQQDLNGKRNSTFKAYGSCSF